MNKFEIVRNQHWIITNLIDKIDDPMIQSSSSKCIVWNILYLAWNTTWHGTPKWNCLKVLFMICRWCLQTLLFPHTCSDWSFRKFTIIHGENIIYSVIDKLSNLIINSFIYTEYFKYNPTGNPTVAIFLCFAQAWGPFHRTYWSDKPFEDPLIR